MATYYGAYLDSVTRGDPSEPPRVTNIGIGDSADDELFGAITHLSPGDWVQAINFLSGGAGDDRAEGVIRLHDSTDMGPHEIYNMASGGSGSDTLISTIYMFSPESYGDLPHNVSYGGSGDDRITASLLQFEEADATNGHSALYGGAGDDRISAHGGNGNILEGNQGDDRLIGSNGSDRLIGGQGDDFLRGRGGEDTFVFGSIRDGERDRVLDFTIGEDVIDISGIDANAYRRGNQSFTFSNADEFHGTGLVWVEDRGATTVVYADNGPDLLRVLIRDGWGVDADDYGAGDFLL